VQGFQDENSKGYPKGHLKFYNKMKLDGNPFPQNMIGFSVNMVAAEENVSYGPPWATTSVGTRTDNSLGPWDYPTCVARYLMA
jgi:hypothetical protein